MLDIRKFGGFMLTLAQYEKGGKQLNGGDCLWSSSQNAIESSYMVYNSVPSRLKLSLPKDG